MAPIDVHAVEQAVATLLRALGHEPLGELARTPALAARAWCDELLDGYRLDPAAILREQAVPVEPAHAGLVALHGLDVTMICPHHLLPASGEATLVYLPTERVAGFGTLARALAAVTHRLVFQEHAGSQMAELLVSELGARGAACRLRLAHACLSARGVRQARAAVETLAFSGSFSTPGPDRDAATLALGAAALPQAEPHPSGPGCSEPQGAEG